MDEVVGPLSVKRTWSAVDGRCLYRMAWTAKQLRRIGQAMEQGDEAYLEKVEEAMRRALKRALTPQIPEANEAEVKRLVSQHWSGRAARFDELPNHGLHSEAQHQAWLEVLRRLAGPEPLQVLDVGCGTGFLALLLAELGHAVTGIDLAPEMLQIARRKADQAQLRVELRLGDAESLEEPDGPYDLVVARHLIWTLPNPRRAVREWLRVLKPGGRLGLVEGQWEKQQLQAAYERLRNQLPFVGGQPAARLAAFLSAQGVRDIVAEPLMDPTLWGEVPHHPRYLLVGRRPS